MNSKTLLSTLKKFFLNKPDLMRHLHINACWEYKIYENSLHDNEVKLRYFLYKIDDENLVITQKEPEIIPDLILFFTEESILNLIRDNPSSELYYDRYRKLLLRSSNNQVDNKINKSRFNLLRLGYQKWQKDFKF